MNKKKIGILATVLAVSLVLLILFIHFVIQPQVNYASESIYIMSILWTLVGTISISFTFLIKALWICFIEHYKSRH